MEESPENKIANGPPRNRHERRERETKAKHSARHQFKKVKRRETRKKEKFFGALRARKEPIVIPETAKVEFISAVDPQFLTISIVKDPPDPRCRIHNITNQGVPVTQGLTLTGTAGMAVDPNVKVTVSTEMPVDMARDEDGRLHVVGDRTASLAENDPEAADRIDREMAQIEGRAARGGQ